MSPLRYFGSGLKRSACPVEDMNVRCLTACAAPGSSVTNSSSVRRSDGLPPGLRLGDALGTIDGEVLFMGKEMDGFVPDRRVVA
jgi:hypothetical protein